MPFPVTIENTKIHSKSIAVQVTNDKLIFVVVKFSHFSTSNLQRSIFSNKFCNMKIASKIPICYQNGYNIVEKVYRRRRKC